MVDIDSVPLANDGGGERLSATKPLKIVDHVVVVSETTPLDLSSCTSRNTDDEDSKQSDISYSATWSTFDEQQEASCSADAAASTKEINDVVATNELSFSTLRANYLLVTLAIMLADGLQGK